MLKAVALPTEHGGWALTLEPVAPGPAGRSERPRGLSPRCRGPPRVPRVYAVGKLALVDRRWQRGACPRTRSWPIRVAARRTLPVLAGCFASRPPPPAAAALAAAGRWWLPLVAGRAVVRHAQPQPPPPPRIGRRVGIAVPPPPSWSLTGAMPGWRAGCGSCSRPGRAADPVRAGADRRLQGRPHRAGRARRRGPRGRWRRRPRRRLGPLLAGAVAVAGSWPCTVPARTAGRVPCSAPGWWCSGRRSYGDRRWACSSHDHGGIPMTDTTATLADLVTAAPGAARVLERFELDYCCGGRQRLGDACAARGVDPAEVIATLDATARSPNRSGRTRTRRPRGPSRADPPRVPARRAAPADRPGHKVAGVHGRRHPELDEVARDVRRAAGRPRAAPAEGGAGPVPDDPRARHGRRARRRSTAGRWGTRSR